MTLSEKLEYYRIDRPDEWTMDEFKREARKLECKIAVLTVAIKKLKGESHDRVD